MIKLEKHKVYTVLCRKPLSLWKPKTWVHLIVRIRSKSPFDHVGFMFYDQRWMLAESTTGKVRVLTFKNWLQIAKTRCWIQENRYACYKRKQMIEYALACEGVIKYDFLGLVWMMIYLKKKIWFGSKNPATQKQRQFCSEFFFNAMGVSRAQYKTPHDAFLAGNTMLGYCAGMQKGEVIILPNVKFK